MAREGLIDDSGVEFEYECSAESYLDCRECLRKDLCSDYEELKIEYEEQLAEEEEWNKYYYSTRL